jgi:predicted oxidoreductase
MPAGKPQKRDELLSTVRDSLRRAEVYCARTRRWDTLLLIISIVCGAVATVLAGGTVIGGKPALEAVGGWRILCSIVAVLTASGTVAGALHKSFQITTRLSSAEKCVARLRALDATIAASDLPTDTALETFGRISEEHAVCLA